MGYSCSARASATERAIRRLIGPTASNRMPDGGLYETGRERADGSIIGTVWSAVPGQPMKITRRGSFWIDGDGMVVRFPGLPAALLRQAEVDGLAEYKALHGTWRERAVPFLAGLESGDIIGEMAWPWFEDIHREWVLTTPLMFATEPAPNNADMAAALRDMLGD